MANRDPEIVDPEREDEDIDLDDNNDEFERYIQTESSHIENTTGDTKIQLIVDQKKSIVKRFYEIIKEKYNLDVEYIDLTNFKLGPDHKKLFLLFKDREILLNKEGGGFIALSTLAGRIGPGGTAAIRDLLKLPDYKKKLPQKAVSALQNIQKILPNNVDEIEMTELPNTINTIEQEIITVLSSEKEIQTEVDMREMDGVLTAMTTVKEELANELGKLNETNKEISKEKDKLEQAKKDNDQFQIERISNRLRELESERSAKVEVININREILRSQVNRIKETIQKVLKEDTKLGEKIKTLFREQGITIVSVLTAFGMSIGVIVETLIPGGVAPTTTPTTPPKPGGIKDWVKKQLANIAKLLGDLAGKAASAIPGIIGSIVSWLLSTTGNVVNWFSQNLWTLLVLVVGMLFTAINKYYK